MEGSNLESKHNQLFSSPRGGWEGAVTNYSPPLGEVGRGLLPIILLPSGRLGGGCHQLFSSPRGCWEGAVTQLFNYPRGGWEGASARYKCIAHSENNVACLVKGDKLQSKKWPSAVRKATSCNPERDVASLVSITSQALYVPACLRLRCTVRVQGLS